jgi:hypothetical protein
VLENGHLADRGQQQRCKGRGVGTSMRNDATTMADGARETALVTGAYLSIKKLLRIAFPRCSDRSRPRQTR